MVTLDWQLTHAGEATLVELVVTSDANRRVEIESTLKPVWPPRRRNRPAAGWDDTGFEGVVTAGEPLVLGYASPADPAEPPATVVETGPVPDTGDETPTPEELVRSLGEAAPPRDAVPSSGDQSTGARQDNLWSGPDRPGTETETETSDAGTNEETDTGQSGPAETQHAVDQTPGAAVDAWLAAVEGRLETAERLAAVETAAEARAAVDDAGGIEAVQTLCERLDADRDRIERLDAGDLGERVDGVEVPLSALERLT